jgi:hypothetical protein
MQLPCLPVTGEEKCNYLMPRKKIIELVDEEKET